MAVEKP